MTIEQHTRSARRRNLHRAVRSRGDAQQGDARNRRQGPRPALAGRGAPAVGQAQAAGIEGEAVDHAKAAARATDDYVHDNPWQAIGDRGGRRLRRRPADEPPLDGSRQSTRWPAAARTSAPRDLRGALARLARVAARPGAHAPRARRVEFTEEARRASQQTARAAARGAGAARCSRCSSSRCCVVGCSGTPTGSPRIVGVVAVVFAGRRRWRCWRCARRTRRRRAAPFAATLAELETRPRRACRSRQHDLPATPPTT